MEYIFRGVNGSKLLTHVLRWLGRPAWWNCPTASGMKSSNPQVMAGLQDGRLFWYPFGHPKETGMDSNLWSAIFGWKGRVLNHIQMVFHQRLLSRLTEALSWIATDVSAPSSNNWPGLFLWYSMYPDFCWWFPLSCFPLACGLEHRCILRSMHTASWPERCTSWVGTVLLEGNGRFVWWVILAVETRETRWPKKMTPFLVVCFSFSGTWWLIPGIMCGLVHPSYK